MSSMIAISSTIILCLTGVPIEDNKCSDGKPRAEITVNILTAEVPDFECKNNWNEWLNSIKQNWRLPTCVTKWESVLEISRDRKVVFRLKPNGTSEVSKEYSPDKGAKDFYRALIHLMKEIKQ